ncbi:MAG: ATP-binding cassette domain-containing protein [bacterium]
MEPAFELKNVTKRFRRADGSWNDALQGVSLTVRPGEAVAVIGPSGAGKTTLLRLLNQTLRPDAGEILVAGKNPGLLTSRELRGLRAQTATIYQQHNLVPNLRVVHNILAGKLFTWSLSRAVVSLLFPRNVQQAAEAAGSVGILNKFWERTDRLSGGEQQRVAISRALIQNPRNLLADEPVASVDPSRADLLITLLRQVTDPDHKTLIVNLHDVPLALRNFPRIVGLHDGKLFFDLPPEEISGTLLARLYEGEESIEGEQRPWIADTIKEGQAG